MKLSKTAILKTLSQSLAGEMRLRDFQKSFRLNEAGKDRLQEILDELVKDDFLRLRKSKWYRKGASKKRLPRGDEFSGESLSRKERFEKIFHQEKIPVQFPQNVMIEADEVCIEPTLDNLPDNVVDLQHIPLITIDPVDAKDFDDAIAATGRETSAGTRLYVAIADVSHYVVENAAIDSEAFFRGTSVYVPGTVNPMLPFELSSGVCSLKPNVLRMSMVVMLDYAGDGSLEHVAICQAVIKSRAALSYQNAQDILDGKIQPDPELKDSFENMTKLYMHLARHRKKRGSLNLDIDEQKIVIEDDEIKCIKRTKRGTSNMLVEEFMLAANEAVATFLIENDCPCVFRVHEKPDQDKIADFANTSKKLGYNFEIKGKITAKKLNSFLRTINKTKDNAYLNTLLLRSLKQATYSAENVGHFGLALQKYAHFTSPIRRYPDLIVHRLIKIVLANKLDDRRIWRLENTLPNQAAVCTSNERRAVVAERKALSQCQAEYMEQFIGESYKATIAGVQSFAFFVQLKEPFVEGMVHVSQLKGDFFEYDEKIHALIGTRSKQQYKLGQKVDVKLISVDIAKGYVDFGLIENAKTKGRGKAKASRKKVATKKRKSTKSGRRYK